MVPVTTNQIISYDEKDPHGPHPFLALAHWRKARGIHLCLAQFASQGFDGGSGIHTSEEHVWREI